MTTALRAYAYDERRHRLVECDPDALGAICVGIVGPRCSTWVRTLSGMRLLVDSQPERPDKVARAAGIISGLHGLCWLGMSTTGEE